MYQNVRRPGSSAARSSVRAHFANNCLGYREPSNSAVRQSDDQQNMLRSKVHDLPRDGELSDVGAGRAVKVTRCSTIPLSS